MPQPRYDFVNNDSNPEDDHGHGSHCAGTIIDGNLPNVKIMPLKVLDAEGYGNSAEIILAMEYASLNGLREGFQRRRHSRASTHCS